MSTTESDWLLWKFLRPSACFNRTNDAGDAGVKVKSADEESTGQVERARISTYGFEHSRNIFQSIADGARNRLFDFVKTCPNIPGLVTAAKDIHRFR
jgi:hypothetical protein